MTQKNNLIPPKPPKRQATQSSQSGQERQAQAVNFQQKPTSPSISAEYEICSWLLRLKPEDVPHAQNLYTLLNTGDFTEPVFASIFDIAHGFIEKNEVCGTAALLDKAQQLNINVGSIEDLTDIVTDPLCALVDNQRIIQNATIIGEHAKRRSLRRILQDAISQLDDEEALTVSSRLNDDLNNLQQSASANEKAEHISHYIEQVIEKAYSEDDASNVVSVGLEHVDEKLGGGLRDGELVVLAGRPSMGKTALAFGVARNISLDPRHQRHVLTFSLEMSGDSLATRVLASEAAVPAMDLRKGGIDFAENPEYTNNLMEVMGRFASYDPSNPDQNTSRLWIDDTSGLTLSQIRSRARKFANEFGSPIIVIDYLQIIAAEKNSHLSRSDLISYFTRELKQLARELNCPVVVLSQLNRTLEQRLNKRPIMADLRESGAIEQDADIILFIYRDVVYNPDTPEPDASELIFAKQRDGSVGVVPITFNPKFVRFSSRYV